ncbi:MAG: hypothetical protein LV479_04470 [Methylacidiphilales bacterium]|nr:hypothetical protein [Candidatus Methylacidiphilales bacterium]
MNTNSDLKWKSLLAHSAPTFAIDAMPPYGFITSMLTRMETEKRQQEMMEKIGLRAIFASLGALAVVVTITVSLNLKAAPDLEPGMRGIVQEATFSPS